MMFIVAGNKLIVPEGVRSIGFYDLCNYLSNDSIEEVVLPNSLENIGDDTFFDYQQIKKINIPKNVKSIGAQAFWGLDKLKELTIFDTISSIGKHAFCNCSELKLTIVGNGHSAPQNWDPEIVAGVGEIFYTTKI